MSDYIARVDQARSLLATVHTPQQARRLLAVAEGLVVAARKEYKASQRIGEAKEDKDWAYGTAVQASELRLLAEAKLGELLAVGVKHDGGRPRKNGSTESTVLRELGLSKWESMRSQHVAAHQDLIPAVLARAVGCGDIPTLRDMEKAIRTANETERLNQQIAQIADVEVPTGYYDVIVIDPPWRYEKRSGDPTHRGRTPYPTMATDEIAAMDVPCADDCVVWLWATNAHLPDGFRVVSAWGLTYKTLLTWAKPHIGLGDWLRGQTEHCIMAVKGRPAIKLTNQSTLLCAPTTGHSTKPDAFYRLVDSLCPGRRLEMFAREQRVGWDVHGGEICD